MTKYFETIKEHLVLRRGQLVHFDLKADDKRSFIALKINDRTWSEKNDYNGLL